ncbi:MAG TPA: hypothetical protein DCY86_08070 [Bdellovibrionales bacterium]|nr:hypothetical protein [Bdellovibrionales bacterium]
MLEHLISLIPPPRINLIRYHGVFRPDTESEVYRSRKKNRSVGPFEIQSGSNIAPPGRFL